MAYFIFYIIYLTIYLILKVVVRNKLKTNSIQTVLNWIEYYIFEKNNIE